MTITLLAQRCRIELSAGGYSVCAQALHRSDAPVDGDQVAARASEVARAHRVAVKPPHVHHHVEGLAKDRVHDGVAFIGFGVDGDPQFVHTISSLVEGDPSVGLLPQRRAAPSQHRVVCSPAAQQIVKGSFHRVMEHGEKSTGTADAGKGRAATSSRVGP